MSDLVFGTFGMGEDTGVSGEGVGTMVEVRGIGGSGVRGWRLGRNIYMVREHHVIVLSVNHVSVLYMKLYVSGGSHIQYT